MLKTFSDLQIELEGLEQCVYDHYGKKYCSVVSMCNAYHVNPNDYRASIRAGKSVETALLENVRKDFAKKDYVLDYHGNQYPNTRAMTDAYGINYYTYFERIRKGYTLEQALEFPIGKKRERFK